MAEKVIARIRATIHAGGNPVAPGEPVTMDRVDAERLIAVFGGECEPVAKVSRKIAAKPDPAALAAAEQAVTDAADALDAAIKEAEGIPADNTEATAAALASIKAKEKALTDAQAALAALKAG